VTLFESVRACLGRYAEFEGTASRAEYWWFALFVALGTAVATAAEPRYGTIFALLTLLPLLAAGSRRLHEIGWSGWAQLFALVPAAGLALVAILMALPPKESARDGADGPQPARA
jgi:uncharacterized membrane protein YhaH (DUF805 family)